MQQNSEAINPWSESDDDKLLPQGTIEIFSYIDQLNQEREPKLELSASSMSRCHKANWYQYNGYESEPLNPRAGLVFMFGDLTEHMMKHLIKEACVGPNKLYSKVDFGKKTGTFTIQHREFDVYEQQTLNISFGTVEITGHADGWGKRNSDNAVELIEIKSAAAFGFDRFKAGETPDYILQAHALMMSDLAKKRKVKGVRFFYMNKNTSHVFDRYYPYDGVTAQKVMESYGFSTSLEEPERPYEAIEETYYKKKTGRKILQFPCSYCGFKSYCFNGVKREINKGKPVWVIE